MQRSQRRTLVAALAAAFSGGLVVAASCALPSYSVDDSMGPDAGTPADGGGGTGAAASGGGGAGQGANGGQGGGLPNIGGMLSECGDSGMFDTAMVAVPGGYCIDETEVSADDYQNWLGEIMMTMEVPAALEAITECAGQWTDFPSALNPDSTCIAGMEYETAMGDYPVACVDWCDAMAYCVARGKHLCGGRGGGGGDYDSFDDPVASEWHNACSSGGENDYPYGDLFNLDKCNTLSGGPGQATEVGTKPSCQPSAEGYQEVRDLSGNVAEWENSCNGSGADALCRVRGGHWGSTDADALCADETPAARSAHDKFIGFRCCWIPSDELPLIDGGAG